MEPMLSHEPSNRLRKLCWVLGVRIHRNRRPTSQLACAQSLIVAAATLMAVYYARLSMRHYQQDARASPADGAACVVRDVLSRADTTTTPNRASLDATIEEKMALVH